MADQAFEVRMRANIDGLVEGVQSPRRGDIVPVSTRAAGDRLVRVVLAQWNLTGNLGRAYETAS
jgi:hypothetical protein